MTEPLLRLRDALDGDLVLPADEDYDAAREAWSLAVDQRPLAVVRAASIEDIARTLRAARESGCAVLPQATGHGALDSLEGLLLLRTEALDRVEVDEEAAVLRVQAGARWESALAALDRGGRWLAPSGTSETVSVLGLALGGGHGWASRRQGLTAQALRRARVVTADGAIRWVDDASDPALLWALRGAGGQAGVVVAEAEFALSAVDRLRGGTVRFALADAPAALRACRDLAPTAPEGLSLFASLVRLPDLEAVPEHLRGSTSLEVTVVLADVDDAVLQPLLEAATPLTDGDGSPIMRSVRNADLPGLTSDPRDPGAAANAARLLRSLDDATIDRLCAFRDESASEPLVAMQLRMLGGALDRPERAAIADTRQAPWLVYGVAPLLPGVSREAAAVACDALHGVVAAVAAPFGLPTFRATGDDLRAACSPEELLRLAHVRGEADPDGVIHPMGASR